jgi:hypothetical protein
MGLSGYQVIKLSGGQVAGWVSLRRGVSVRLSVKGLTLQLALENFTDQSGVGFAFAEFHDLAFKEVQGGNFAGFEIGGWPGISGDGLLAEPVECAGVADLGEPFLIDNLIRRFAGFEHFSENLLGDFGADLAALH